MPIYEYECKKCGYHMEVWQKFSDPEMTKCELCKGRIRKLISQSTFHLKGTGWYVTDYASNRGGNRDGGTDKEKTPAKEKTTEKATGSSDQAKKEAS
jgi:putative FmdB family regulatory protein